MAPTVLRKHIARGFTATHSAGLISKVQMEKYVSKIYNEFDATRKTTEAEQANNENITQLKELEIELKYIK